MSGSHPAQPVVAVPFCTSSVTVRFLSARGAMFFTNRRRMDPDRAAAFAADMMDEEKLKDLTAADGTLPGGGSVALLQTWRYRPVSSAEKKAAKFYVVGS